MMRYLICTILFLFQVNLYAMAPKVQLHKAIDRAATKHGLPVEPKLKSYFQKAHVAYPPKEVAFLSFKKEKKIELWARGTNQSWRYIHTYPLTAYSGKLGPKLKEHDLQIPEGIYRLSSFNPYSAHHLSMMINYPNEFDKSRATDDRRKKLGGNIFLHGKNTSVGCLAVGNDAIDQFFILVRRVGLSNTKVIISPNDLRTDKAHTNFSKQPKWVPELYKKIKYALKEFPAHRKIT